MIVAYFTGSGRPVKDIVGAFSEVWASPDLVFGGRDRVNVVFIGIDVNRDRRGMPYTKNSRSDTILVVNFDRLAQTICAVSIPRDTIAHIPDHYTTKINAAHALGGPDLLLATLSESLGVQSDYYIKVKFAGLEKAVDAVGGVDLEVEKDMDYDDDWGQLHIHLKQGYQHLDGAKAHQYARFRHDAMGDIGRVARQQKLMRTLAKKILSPAMIPHIPQLMKVFQQYVETNMTTAQLMSLGAFIRSVNPDTITTATLPGTPQGGYWVANREEAAVILSEKLGETFDMNSWNDRYARSVSGLGAGRRHAAERASEPPLETTASIPAGESVPRDRSHVDEDSSLGPRGLAEPVIIDGGTKPSTSVTTKPNGSQPTASGTAKPASGSETRANTGSDTGSGKRTDSGKPGDIPKPSPVAKPEPPALAPDHDPPASDSSGGKDPD